MSNNASLVEMNEKKDPKESRYCLIEYEMTTPTTTRTSSSSFITQPAQEIKSRVDKNYKKHRKQRD